MELTTQNLQSPFCFIKLREQSLQKIHLFAETGNEEHEEHENYLKYSFSTSNYYMYLKAPSRLFYCYSLRKSKLNNIVLLVY